MEKNKLSNHFLVIRSIPLLLKTVKILIMVGGSRQYFEINYTFARLNNQSLTYYTGNDFIFGGIFVY